jgi:AmmeMemoRadiSam system protein A/AmmeMemoRadiSam system protein B
MAHTSSLVFAGIAPHPPIMVPEVGREAIAEVRSSINGMAELTQRVVDCGAETLITISPHAPLDASAFVAFEGPQIYGDFANFRAPTATVHADLDDELLKEIERVAAEHGLMTKRIRGYDLDHGTAVPLYFLQRNGWSGKVIALGYSFVSGEDHVRFGQCIKQAVENIGRPVAFIASGDLSHRLKLGAPAGFSPDAHLFDEEIVDAIRNNATRRIVHIDQEIRRTAGECGYRSMLVAIGAVESLPSSSEVISYEAPFGVGYLVAQLMSGQGPTSPSPSGRGLGEGLAAGNPFLSSQPTKRATEVIGPPATAGGSDYIPALARLTIETFIRDERVIDPPNNLPADLNARAGCFVSIKTRAADLRGCIGTIDPAKDTLAEEIICNAISAATRDPRFSPVRADELPNLKYSVDVLTVPEPATIADLDPQVYGVIVEEENGPRRGLLLPNLEGIDTATRQVEIAFRKAGILPGARVRIFRFRAERYSE